jgi:protein phosphatase 1 regulatory subunit 7
MSLIIDLNHGRVGQIERWELTNLKRLFLRWNLIKKIENLEAFTDLAELELYDNQITQIEGLDANVNLV